MELVRYSPSQVKPAQPIKNQRLKSATVIPILVCAAAAIFVFLFLSERATARRLEAERAQMAAQLNNTSARLHALSVEVNSLTASHNALPNVVLVTPHAVKASAPRANYAVAKLPVVPAAPAAKQPVVVVPPPPRSPSPSQSSLLHPQSIILPTSPS